MSQPKGLRPIPARPIQPRNARAVPASPAPRSAQSDDDDEDLDLAVLAESMLPDNLGQGYGERPDRFWLWTTLAAMVAVGGAFWTFSTLMAGAPTQSANSMLQPVASASASQESALGPSVRPEEGQSSLLIVEYGGMPTPTPTPESTLPPPAPVQMMPAVPETTPPPLETLPSAAPTAPIQLNRPVGSGNNAMLAPPALGAPKLPPPSTPPSLQPTAAAPTQYQVTAGPYASADEAQAAAQELSQRGHKVGVYPDKDRHRLKIGVPFAQQEEALVLAEEVSLLGYQVVVRRSE